ncbi:MAG TPA: zf-HC2 domain-containing protein [Candidatus Methylomirabilis sp.]|nr:zf-HC2 domain-containing protein [Candidatus Methylomirabilis sp.]
MTCKDAIDILADFLDQTLAPEVLESLEAHLRDCEPCRAYLNTYRRTQSLVGEAGRVEMPPELKTRLRDLLMAQFSRREA